MSQGPNISLQGAEPVTLPVKRAVHPNPSFLQLPTTGGKIETTAIQESMPQILPQSQLREAENGMILLSQKTYCCIDAHFSGLLLLANGLWHGFLCRHPCAFETPWVLAVKAVMWAVFGQSWSRVLI